MAIVPSLENNTLAQSVQQSLNQCNNRSYVYIQCHMLLIYNKISSLHSQHKLFEALNQCNLHLQYGTNKIIYHSVITSYVASYLTSLMYSCIRRQ